MGPGKYDKDASISVSHGATHYVGMKMEDLEAKVYEQETEIEKLQDAYSELESERNELNREVERLKEGYQLSEFDSRPCPGCRYENGKFIAFCNLHNMTVKARNETNKAREVARKIYGSLTADRGELHLQAWKNFAFEHPWLEDEQ